MARYKCLWFSSFRIGVYNLGNYKVVRTRHHAERLLRLGPLLLWFSLSYSPFLSKTRMPLGQVSRCLGTCSNEWGTVLDFSSQHRDEKDEEARRQWMLCSAGLAGWERHIGCLLDVLARNPLWGELRLMLFHVRLELPSEGPCKHITHPS